MTEVLTELYRQGTLTADELRVEIDQARTEIITDEQALQEMGITRADAEPVGFNVAGDGGFDPATVLIAISISFTTGAASEAGKVLLRKVLARIREKHGDDALGDREE